MASNSFGSSGSIAYAGVHTPGIDLWNCEISHRDRKPVPPIEEYQAYYETLSRTEQKAFNPRMMRRLAIVVREGNTVGGAAKLLGMNIEAKSKRYLKMPDHLK